MNTYHIKSTTNESRTAIFSGINEETGHTDSVVFATGTEEWAQDIVEKHPCNADIPGHDMTIVFDDLESLERMRKCLNRIYDQWVKTKISDEYMSQEGIELCSEASKPYSDEDYEDAKQQGLDLDDWNNYKKYYHMEEYADDQQDWWRS
jgi:hypothetical protein